MKFRTISSVVLIAILSSCGSTKFTDEQKAAMRPISVAQASVPVTAYEKPAGNAENDGSLANATGVAGGAIGAALGHLITEGVSMAQKSSFKKNYGEAAEKAQGTIPSDLSSMLAKANNKALSGSPFFAGQVKSSASNSLKTDITSYGYRRVGKKDGRILMTPYVNGTVSIVSNGQVIVKPISVSGAAYQANQGGYEITQYVANKSVARSDFEKACLNFSQNVKMALESRL